MLPCLRGNGVDLLTHSAAERVDKVVHEFRYVILAVA